MPVERIGETGHHPYEIPPQGRRAIFILYLQFLIEKGMLSYKIVRHISSCGEPVYPPATWGIAYLTHLSIDPPVKMSYLLLVTGHPS
jgi:hypothetical protein